MFSVNNIKLIPNHVVDKVKAKYQQWVDRDSYILTKPFAHMSLDDCYQYCEALTRNRGTNFYLGFTMLPKKKRRAVFASYAFCRYVDDLVDEDEGSGRMKIEAALMKWQRYLDNAYAGEGGSHPITRALAHTIQNYPVQKSSFMRLIDGGRMDIIKNRYETFEELVLYCELVATTISEISLAIFGYNNILSVEYGRYLAIALQLTNIIRDVGEDAKRGRIYLPLEDLKRFGYSETELLRCEFNDKFVDLMKFQIKRAREYYTKANPLLKNVNKDSKMGIYLMGAVYVNILDKIQRLGIPVLNRKVGLSFIERQTLLVKGLIAPSVYIETKPSLYIENDSEK